MAVNNGGHAFPLPPMPAGVSSGGGLQHGMTLRQWYAGQALADVVGHVGINNPQMIAEKVFAIADAMILEGHRR